MNPLNTAQWMAIMNNQDSISNLLQSLNRLLYHNLGKMDQPTTLQGGNKIQLKKVSKHPEYKV